MTDKRQIRVLPRCRSDVLDCVEWITRDSPAAARRFAEAFEEAVRSLEDYPFSGGPANFRHPSLRDCRTWTVPGFRNWLIIYRVTDETVDAIRVVHGARDLDALDD